MKLRPACEVESCMKDRDTLIKIADLFHVDLCHEHHKILREALFTDSEICSALEALRGCNASMLVIIEHADRKPTEFGQSLITIQQTITEARALVYKAIMAWLKKAKAS